jgi:hypothetical protein
MVIHNKHEFYRRSRSGQLGNTLRSWVTAQDLVQSNYTGLIGIRSIGSTGGGPFLSRLTVSEAVEKSKTWPTKYIFSEVAPDHKLLLQGELARLVGGLYMSYNTTPNLNLREGMLVAKHSHSLHTKLLLENNLTPSALDDLYELLDLCPDAVIEFTAYDCNLGVLPHRNAIIWEVRNY